MNDIPIADSDYSEQIAESYDREDLMHRYEVTTRVNYGGNKWRDYVDIVKAGSVWEASKDVPPIHRNYDAHVIMVRSIHDEPTKSHEIKSGDVYLRNGNAFRIHQSPISGVLRARRTGSDKDYFPVDFTKEELIYRIDTGR